MKINYEIEKFRQELFNIINNCGLPVGIAYLVVKDIYFMLNKEYQIVIEKESLESDKAINMVINQNGDISIQEE